ncbi:MAG: lysozyme inhibitor LprI family protein [Bacteroidota bacterium]
MTLGLRAQPEYSHLAEQSYLKYYEAHPFDCANIPDSLFSTLSMRICANIKLREQDVILAGYVDSVRQQIGRWKDDTLLMEFEALQKAWRRYRDRKASLIYQSYEGCGGCHLRSIHYMGTLRRMTEIRIEELQRLLTYYRQEEY